MQRVSLVTPGLERAASKVGAAPTAGRDGDFQRVLEERKRPDERVRAELGPGPQQRSRATRPRTEARQSNRGDRVRTDDRRPQAERRGGARTDRSTGSRAPGAPSASGAAVPSGGSEASGVGASAVAANDGQATTAAVANGANAMATGTGDGAMTSLASTAVAAGTSAAQSQAATANMSLAIARIKLTPQVAAPAAAVGATGGESAAGSPLGAVAGVMAEPAAGSATAKFSTGTQQGPQLTPGQLGEAANADKSPQGMSRSYARFVVGDGTDRVAVSVRVVSDQVYVVTKTDSAEQHAALLESRSELDQSLHQHGLALGDPKNSSQHQAERNEQTTNMTTAGVSDDDAPQPATLGHSILAVA